jgi:hypothetical protein
MLFLLSLLCLLFLLLLLPVALTAPVLGQLF